MARIGNADFSRREIERRVGDLRQLGGIRHCELSEGRARGVRAAVVDAGAGLSFTVLPDIGLDIADCSYKGVGLVYHAPGGIAHPAFRPGGKRVASRVFGGLLTTCGLTFFGDPGGDGGEELGLHGRYASQSARQVCDLSRREGEERVLELTGIVEEVGAVRRQASPDPVDLHGGGLTGPSHPRPGPQRGVPDISVHDPVPCERGLSSPRRVQRADPRLPLDSRKAP